MPSHTSTLSLISSDDRVLEVELGAAEVSLQVKRVLEDDEKASTEIRLPRVCGDVLKKAMEWCEYHRNDALARKAIDANGDEIGQWDREYLTMDNEFLLQLALAANYLKIPQLLITCMKRVREVLALPGSEDFVNLLCRVEGTATPEVDSHLPMGEEDNSEEGNGSNGA